MARSPYRLLENTAVPARQAKFPQVFDADPKTGTLVPTCKPTAFQRMAEAMARELTSTRLSVAKQKTDRGYVRVVLGENPQWYRDFCAEHRCRRRSGRDYKKHDTSIRRHTTLRALRMIAAGEKPKSALYPGLKQPTYCEWLKPVIEREIRREKEQFRAERASALKRELAGVPF